MFGDLAKSFAALKITIDSDGVGEAADAQLETANGQFVALLDDWTTMGVDEQSENHSEFILAQRNFHYVAGRLLNAVQNSSTESSENSVQPGNSEPLEISEPTVDTELLNQVKDGAPNLPLTDVPDTSLQAQNHGIIGSATNDGDSHLSDQEQQMQIGEQFKQMCVLSYADHMRILDPVYSLRPIEHIDEHAINEIIVCINETMTRAVELDVMMPLEVHRCILSYIQGLLDLTSQSMLAWRFTDGEASLDELVDFLQVRAERIFPAERSSSSRRDSPVPSAPKKVKKVCPMCKGNHNLIRCPQLLSVPMNDRRRTVQIDAFEEK